MLIVGPLLASSGLLQLGLRLEPTSSYTTVVLPALACVAAGMGVTFVALTSSAVAGVSAEDSGLGSALLNAGQQVGSALGLAVLTAVSVSHTSGLLKDLGAGAADPVAQANALVDGWGVGFLVGSAFLLGAAVIAGSLVKVSKEAAAAALKESGAGAI
jgi:hypothetical protein